MEFLPACFVSENKQTNKQSSKKPNSIQLTYMVGDQLNTVKHFAAIDQILTPGSGGDQNQS